VKRIVDYRLASIDELFSNLGAGTVVATADWPGIGQVLAARCPAGITLIQEARMPRARAVGFLALASMAAGTPGKPPVPLYMHPPVETRAAVSSSQT